MNVHVEVYDPMNEVAGMAVLKVSVDGRRSGRRAVTRPRSELRPSSCSRRRYPPNT